MSNNKAQFFTIASCIGIFGVLTYFIVTSSINKSSSALEKYQTTCNRKNYRTNSDYNQEYTGDSSRDLCLCSGGGKQLCANRQELLDSYNDGNTEYQNFAAKQKDIGGPFWHSTNFDNY